RRDHEADLVDAALDHALEQIFAHRAWPLTGALAPAADRQELLRKGKRLDAAAASPRRDYAPHSPASMLCAKTGLRSASNAATISSARRAEVWSARNRAYAAAAI